MSERTPACRSLVACVALLSAPGCWKSDPPSYSAAAPLLKIVKP